MNNNSNSLVTYAKSDDPELAAASARAVASFKYLWRELTWQYRRIVPALDLSADQSSVQRSRR